MTSTDSQVSSVHSRSTIGLRGAKLRRAIQALCRFAKEMWSVATVPERAILIFAALHFSPLDEVAVIALLSLPPVASAVAVVTVVFPPVGALVAALIALPVDEVGGSLLYYRTIKEIWERRREQSAQQADTNFISRTKKQ